MKAKKLFPDISFRRLVRPAVPVDNLESTDVDRPLSANMGREIKNQIDESNKNLTNVSKCSVVSDYSDKPIYFFKKGNNKGFYINGLKNITTSTITYLCEVPTEYLPALYFCEEKCDVTGVTYRIQIVNGKLAIYYYGATTGVGNVVNAFFYFLLQR